MKYRIRKDSTVSKYNTYRIERTSEFWFNKLFNDKWYLVDSFSELNEAQIALADIRNPQIWYE